MPANIHEYLEQNNFRAVQILERNRDVSGFLLAFVDHCQDYCQRHGIPFEDLRVERPHIEGFDSAFGEYLKARLSHT